MNERQKEILKDIIVLIFVVGVPLFFFSMVLLKWVI